MANDISLRPYRTSDWRIFSVLVNSVNEYFLNRRNRSFDISTLNMNVLTESGILTNQQSRYLMRKYHRTWSTNRKELFSFLRDVYRILVSMPFTLESVYLLGLVDLKDEIVINMSLPERFIGCAEFQDTNFLRRVFFQYKSDCDRNVFICRKSELTTLFHNFRLKILQSEDKERNMNMIRMTVVFWLLTQVLLSCEEIEDLVNEFESELSQYNNVDKTLPDILIQVKRSIIAARKFEWPLSEELMARAFNICQQYNDSCISFMVSHSNFFTYQLRMLENDNEVHQHQGLDVCQNSLDVIICNEMDDLGMYAYRSFCLYKVYVYLHVGPYFEIDITRDVAQSDIEKAEGMLKRVEVSFTSGHEVEPRREMMFYALMARLRQVKGQRLEAIANVHMALKILNDGLQYLPEWDNLRQFKAAIENIHRDHNLVGVRPRPNLLYRN